MTTDLDRKLAEIAGRVERYTSGRYRLTVSAAKMNKDSIPALLRLVAVLREQVAGYRSTWWAEQRHESNDAAMRDLCVRCEIDDAAALAALEGE